MLRPNHLITVSPSGFAICESGRVKKDTLSANQCPQLRLKKSPQPQPLFVNSHYLLSNHIYKYEISLHSGRYAGRKLCVSPAPGIFSVDTKAESLGSQNHPLLVLPLSSGTVLLHGPFLLLHNILSIFGKDKNYLLQTIKMSFSASHICQVGKVSEFHATDIIENCWENRVSL